MMNKYRISDEGPFKVIEFGNYKVMPVAEWFSGDEIASMMNDNS